MTGRLEGRAAIVTGANSGIGLAAAHRLAAEGARVAIVARNIERGEAAVESVRSAGGEAFFISADVSQADEMEALTAQVVDRYGRLDIAVNNAAAPPSEVGTLQPITDISVEQWDRMIAVNLRGTWLGMKYQIPAMIASGGGGSVINVSSTAGGKAFPGMGAYVASKFAINGITKVAALEFAKQGVRVNAILPGPVDSAIVDEVEQRTPGYKKMLSDLVPMERMGLADEIANAIFWLASDESSYVTGTNFPIDGGMIEK